MILPFSFRWCLGKPPVLAGLFFLGTLSLMGSPEPDGNKPAPEATAAPSPAAKATPTDPNQEALREIFARFSAAFDKRDFAKASEALAEGEKLSPDNPTIRAARAGIYAESGDIEKAREIYLALEKEGPDPFIPRFNLAELYFLEKDYSKGREAFEKLLKDYPANDLVRFKIVLSYIGEKKPEQAREALAPLQRSTPTVYFVYALAAVALDQGRLAEGKELILSAERYYGAGQHKLLHDSLAELNLVLRTDYPPARPAQ